MALRLLQNHLGDVEKRIRTARHLDLPSERFYALVVRHQTHADFWQRRGRLATLARFVTASKWAITARRPATTAFGPRPASVFATRTISFASLPRRTFAPRWARSAPAF